MNRYQKAGFIMITTLLVTLVGIAFTFAFMPCDIALIISFALGLFEATGLQIAKSVKNGGGLD